MDMDMYIICTKNRNGAINYIGSTKYQGVALAKVQELQKQHPWTSEFHDGEERWTSPVVEIKIITVKSLDAPYMTYSELRQREDELAVERACEDYFGP